MSQATKISKRYRLKAALCERFAKSSCSCDTLDFSEEAMLACLRWESAGIPLETLLNGYAVGKGWMDVNIAMWKEDIAKGLLFKWELEDLAYLVE
jgi:hypothetical protein